MKRTLYILLLALVATGCENDMKTIMEMDQKASGVEKGAGISIIYSQKAKVNAKLTADSMQRHLENPSFLEFTHGLHIDVYDSTGAVSSTVDARHGKYFDGSADVNLWDHVIVRNVKEQRLDAKTLNWDSKKQVFTSSDSVRISLNRTDTIWGTGLESNQDFTNYKILHPSGPFTIHDQDSTGVASDSTEAEE